MLNKYTFILFTSITLLFSACSSESIVDDIKNTDNSEQENISKKDVIYIIKHTPSEICTSESFKDAMETTMEEAIKEVDIKVVNIKDLITSIQNNDVNCETFKPSDITDLIDPICNEMKAVDIDEAFDLLGLELSDIIDTSCVVAGDIL